MTRTSLCVCRQMYFATKFSPNSLFVCLKYESKSNQEKKQGHFNPFCIFNIYGEKKNAGTHMVDFFSEKNQEKKVKHFDSEEYQPTHTHMMFIHWNNEHT